MAYDGTLKFDTSINAEGFRRGTEKMSGIASKAFAAIGAAAGAALAVIGKVGIQYNAQMEKYTTNFTTMLGSQEAALKKVDALKVMAAKTPFGMEDLAQGTQTLLAFGIESDRTMDILRQIGDVSLGNKDKFSSLTLAFAQMSSAGRLMGQDLLQMVNAGFNPLQVISEQTGESMADLKKKMEEGAISAEMVAEAFAIATSEGGKFYNGMEAASKTLTGQWSTLKDDAAAAAGAMFQPFNDVLSSQVLPNVIDLVGDLTENLSSSQMQGAMTKIAQGFGKLIEAGAELASAVLPPLITVIAGVVSATELLLPVMGAVGVGFLAFKTYTFILQFYKTLTALKTGAVAATGAEAAATTGATAAMWAYNAAQNAKMIALLPINAAIIIYNALTGAQIGLVGGATAAQWGLNAAMLANPIGLIIAGIVALIAIVGGLIAIFGRSSAAYNEEKQKLKEVREEQENYASALRETQSEARKDAQEKIAQAQQNRVLLETLADLVNENGKCKGSLEDVRRAVNDVNSNIDGLGVTLDETTGCINMSSEALREYGKNLEAVAKYEAAQDQYNIMLKERSEQQAKLNALKEQEAVYVQIFYDEKINRKELNALIDETNERIKEQEKIMSGLEVEVESYERAMKNAYNSEEIIAERRTRIFNGQSALVAQYAHQYGLSFEQILNEASKMEGGLEEWQEKIAGRMTESGMDVGMLAKKWGMTAQEVDAYCTQWGLNYDEFNALMKTMHTEAGEDVDALASIWGVSANEIREWIAMNGSDVQGWSDMMEKAWDEYEQTVKDRTSGVINSFEEIPAKSEMSADQMIKILKKNRERYAKWQKNMAQISSMVSAETLAELEKLGPGANSALEEMMKNGGAKLKQFDEEIRKTVEDSTSYASSSQGFHDPRFINAPADAIGQSADAIRDGKTLPAAAQNKVRETKGAMSEAVQSADFLSIGKAIMDGIIAAMDGKATALYAKARQIANRVAGTMRDALAVRSPSRVMIDIYSNVMMGVYKGMEGMEGKLYRKADSISTGIADRLRLAPRAVTSLAGRLKTLTQMNPLQINTPVYAAAGAPGSINYSTNLTQHITSPAPLSPSRITQEAQDLLKRSKWLLP